MKINMIAAMAKNRVIGKDNKLPWNIPADLQKFKEITTGNVIIMGYNTYLSIGRQLPNRRNVILSFEPVPNLEYYTNIQDMLDTLTGQGVDEIFIIGGASLYSQFLDRADKIYLTQINAEYEGDTFFPEFEDKFQEISREKMDGFDFVSYQKI